jgi:hypothetical protein
LAKRLCPKAKIANIFQNALEISVWVIAAAESAKSTAGPGAPSKHDWDAFAGANARRVHDHGMPVSQGELVRDMMGWFAGREDFTPPDERTVRRKVSAIWKELNST